MVLKNIVKHITSSGFWRLIALLGKRLLSIDKIFSKLSPLLLLLFYILHFLRAGLRVVDYFRKTRNKNLGETRKLLFSGFKMAIAIVAISLCCAGLPIPFVLGTAFLLYSVIKLVDSSGVLIFSFFKHFKIDKILPENKWRREQYWDNIIKHSSILAIGVSTTLLTAVALAGGVAAVVWVSPAIVLSFAIASVVTIVGLIYLSSLFYQRYKLSHEDENLKKEFDTTIKKFGKLYAIWLFSLALVAMPIIISFLFPLTPLISIGVAIGVSVLLTIFNLIDAGKSTYDYFDSTKVDEPSPECLMPEKALVDMSVNDYYYRKNRTLYLNTEDSQANELFLMQEGLVKLSEFRNKTPNFFERKKIEVKKEGIISDLIELIRNEGTHDELVNYLLDAVESLNKDYAEIKNSGQLNLKKEVGNVIEDLQKDLDQLLTTITSSCCEVKNPNNFLIDMWIAFKEVKKSNENKSKPFSYSQSFFKHTSDSKDFSDACSAALKIKRESAMDTASVRL